MFAYRIERSLCQLHASDYTENNPCAILRLLWPVCGPRDGQDSRLATSAFPFFQFVLRFYNQIECVIST